MIEWSAQVSVFHPDKIVVTHDTQREAEHFEATVLKCRLQRARKQAMRVNYGDGSEAAAERRTLVSKGTKIARRPRARGAGRPRATATRSSARSGDSGDDGPSDPAPLGAIAERRLRTLLDQVRQHQPETTDDIRRLPGLVGYLDPIYEATLDAAVARGLLVAGPTGRPVSLAPRGVR